MPRWTGQKEDDQRGKAILKACGNLELWLSRTVPLVCGTSLGESNGLDLKEIALLVHDTTRQTLTELR
jgi:hypothetical protein